jgi:hypothetical protein
LVAISAVNMRPGNLIRNVMRGWPAGAETASSSAALSVSDTFSRAAVSVPGSDNRDCLSGRGLTTDATWSPRVLG